MSVIDKPVIVCPGCHVRPGQIHITGCQFEPCSVCGNRWTLCNCEGHEPLASAWTGEQTASAGITYSVDEDGVETRIIRYYGDDGDYPSFEKAREAAVDWLENLIGMCEDRIEEFRSAESYEDCTVPDMDSDNVRSEVRSNGTADVRTEENGMSSKASATSRRVRIHYITDDGWLHTHGMDSLGLPELEVRHVPSFLAEYAAGLLRHVCDYMAESGVRIKPGETMATSPRTRFKFLESKPMPGDEDHYQTERLLIAEIEPTCDCCGAKPSLMSSVQPN